MRSFAGARDAVATGASPEEAARELVAAMTPDERLWCLDGDAPTWAGLGFLGDDGYHKAPFRAADTTIHAPQPTGLKRAPGPAPIAAESAGRQAPR